MCQCALYSLLCRFDARQRQSRSNAILLRFFPPPPGLMWGEEVQSRTWTAGICWRIEYPLESVLPLLQELM